MTLSKLLQIIALKKTEALVIGALLIATGALYIAATSHHQIDPFKLEIQQRTQTVSNVMQGISPSSSMSDFKNVQYQLRLQNSWLNRQLSLNSEQKQESKKFGDYLESCNQVIVAYSQGQKPDLTTMKKLKNELI
jgi:hypothetical protein